MSNPTIDSNGTQTWYVNNRLHRVDGPAMICTDGVQQWYIRGNYMWSPKVYQEAAKLSDEEMSFLLLKYKFK
jgi:hypothetical protein